jgi:hypothetical protein
LSLPDRFFAEISRPLIAVMKPGIRTLFMSGYMADVIATRGVVDQGVNFISKPVSGTRWQKGARGDRGVEGE